MRASTFVSFAALSLVACVAAAPVPGMFEDIGAALVQANEAQAAQANVVSQQQQAAQDAAAAQKVEDAKKAAAQVAADKKAADDKIAAEKVAAEKVASEKAAANQAAAKKAEEEKASAIKAAEDKAAADKAAADKAAADKAAAEQVVEKPTSNVASAAGSGSTYSGKATFYYQGGAFGSCGQVNSDSSLIVAMNAPMVEGGAHCGKSVVITNTANGKQVTATVADTCPGCAYGSLDLSVGAFDAIGSQDSGVLPISWQFA